MKWDEHMKARVSCAFQGHQWMFKKNLLKHSKNKKKKNRYYILIYIKRPFQIERVFFISIVLYYLYNLITPNLLLEEPAPVSPSGFDPLLELDPFE